MKAENMTSSSGNKVANQFVITDEKGAPYSQGVYFQSYKSIIAFIPEYPERAFFNQLGNTCLKDNGLKTWPKLYLDREKWDYSKTTGKYRNQFLGETKAETQKKIDSGEYMLADLN